MSVPSSDSDERVSRVEFEAALLRQEHRLLSILKNYFILRSRFPIGDPRRDAVVEALLWRISVALVPTVAAGGAGLVGVVGIVIAIWANNLISEQNTTLVEQTKLAQAQIERLDKQNELLTKQNENLTVQNQLAEANRRAALLMETTAILNNIEEFVRSEQRDGKVRPDGGWLLPDRLYGRITAASFALRPYQYVRPKDSPQEHWRSFQHYSVPRTNLADAERSDTEIQLIPQSLSPERAHLLISLVALGVDLLPLASRNVTFAYADCHDAELSGAVLRGLNLRGADFSGANLSNADLRDAVLFGADFSAADLGEADCRKTFLDGAIFAHAHLHRTNITGAFCNDSILKYDVLHGAKLDNVDSFDFLFDKHSVERKKLRRNFKPTSVTDQNGKTEVFVVESFHPDDTSPEVRIAPKPEGDDGAAAKAKPPLAN